MNILIDLQAKTALEKYRVPDNSGGVYQDGNQFVWNVNRDEIFDTGEEPTLKEAMSKLKQNNNVTR